MRAKLCLKPTFLLCLFVLSVVSGLSGQSVPISSDEAHRRAEELLKQMTVDEKVGQMNQASGVVAPFLGSQKPDDLIVQGKVGSILWLINAKEMNRLQHLAVDRSRLHIPILFAYDVIHGYRTMFPIPLAMAALWDPSVEEAAQHYAAEDALAAGIRWTFTPMVDIARDSRWGRIVEGAGEDPYLGAAMARAQVRGFQGETIGPESVLACVKHFAGYGAADGGRDYDSSYVPEELMRNVYLVPFHAAEQAGAATFMSAYMDLNDVPATGNRWLLKDVLRKEWDFKGFVVSDAFAVGNLETHGFAKDPADAAYKAVSAGLDMDMASETYTQHLAKLVTAGKVTEAQLDAAVLPILEVKYRLGLFDHPYVDEAKVEERLNRTEGRELERKVAARSMVLLKNENHTLPLRKDVKKIAVIGALADSAHDIEGGWSVESLFGGEPKSHPVTALAGLRNKLGADAEINYVPGPMPARLYPSLFDEISGTKPQPAPTDAQIAETIAKVKAAVTRADVVIAVLGETASMSGESASRTSMELPGIQEQMLEVAASAGKPVVLVLENGRPLDVRWAAQHVPAILESWFPGTEGGNAVADVLFGDVIPGGKLPISWARTSGEEPLYYNHNLTHEPEDRPSFTSRYWDVSGKPLYPFGYGLSYTTFRFDHLRLSRTSIKAGEATEVQVDVTNTGSVAGETVAQIYIHQRWGSASRPARELKGFQRLALQPGETRTLHFPLGKDELEFWSPQTREWAVEPSTFDVWAGEDSTATLHTQLNVTE